MADKKSDWKPEFDEGALKDLIRATIKAGGPIDPAMLPSRVKERIKGRATGDLVHPLPFAPEFYQAEFGSRVADMKNSVANRSNAQSSCAAQFIYAQIDDVDTPWLHVDLAGPAFRDGRGTGFGVALLTDMASSVTKSDLKS